MMNRLICLSMLAVMTVSSAFSQQERTIVVQNFLRFGYSDNVYLDASEVDSAEIIEMLDIVGKMNFSSRTDAVFSYRPEVRYRFDADPELSTYHDAYGMLNHALSPRVFMTVSDRFRYVMREAQSGAISQSDNNYLENDLKGAIDFTASEKGLVKVGGGYEFRVWDDSAYGEDLGNDYDQYTVDGSYLRDLNDGITKLVVAANYVNHEFYGSRGGYDAVTVLGGADHIFNPYLNGFGRVGVSYADVDTVSGSQDSTTPYLDTGLEYNPTDRTSFNGGVGYSIYRAQNSAFNTQDRLDTKLGIRHDITPKISVASSLSFIFSLYEAEFAAPGMIINTDYEDIWLEWNIRGSYQINRNNFIEVGYQFTDRSINENNSPLSEFDRNRVDIGWRLRL